RAFKIAAERVDGNDVRAVHGATARWITEVRAGRGPVFLECMTYRWLEHVGPNFDHELGRTYRTEVEVREWMERCPVKRSAAALVAEGIASAAELDRLDPEMRAPARPPGTRAGHEP